MNLLAASYETAKGLCTKLIRSSDPLPMQRLGENLEPDRQVSPDKLLRAALLRSRYADVIVKARGILSQVTCLTTIFLLI